MDTKQMSWRRNNGILDDEIFTIDSAINLFTLYTYIYIIYIHIIYILYIYNVYIYICI